MLSATGDVEKAMFFATEIPSITNERAARFYLRRLVGVTGELGAIACDYKNHRGRLGAPEQDDRSANCIMAACAGRMVAYAARLLGAHVRDDVRVELERLTSEEHASVRRRGSSVLRTPGSLVTDAQKLDRA